MGRRRSATFGLVLAIAGAANLPGVALTQAPPSAPSPATALPRLPGAVEPGRQERPTLSAPIPQPEFDFQIQQRVGGDTRASDVLRFKVNSITIEGAVTFPPETYKDLTEPMLNQQVSLGDITALAEAIEGRYRAAGFILSRAFVPAQRVGDGNFRIQVVEGFIKSVSVEGASEGVRERIEGYLDDLTKMRPAHIGAIERALLLSTDLPGVNAGGVLRPGDELGATELVVTVKETDITGSASMNNRASRFAGPMSLSAEVNYNNLLGMAEQIGVSHTTTPDLHSTRAYTLRYTQPLDDDGLLLKLESQYSYGEPGFTLKPLDVRSRAIRYGARLSYPLIRGRAENLVIEGGYTWQYSTAYLGQTRSTLSFDTYTAFDVKATYLFNDDLDGINIVSAGVARGVPIRLLETSAANAPSASRAGASPKFTKLTLDALRLQQLDYGFTAAFTLTGQLGMDKLYAGEEFALGGPRIGRPYDPAEITGASGVGGSIELRYADPDWGWGEPFIFYDIGKTFTRGGLQPSFGLSAGGFGIRLNLPAGFAATIDASLPLSRTQANENGNRYWRFGFDLGVKF